MTGFEWIGRLVDLLGSILWPFHKVEPWERGVYTFCGRHIGSGGKGVWWLGGWPYPAEDGSIGPGIWFVFPWFGDIIARDMQPGVISIPRQDVLLRSGDTLTYSVTAGYRIESITKALLNVESHQATTIEHLMGIGEALADVDPARFDAARGKRDRLRKELAEGLDEVTREFGVRIYWVKFPNFIVNKRIYRVVGAENGAAS